MKTIIKGAALLGTLAMLMRKRKARKGSIVRDENKKPGLWRRSAPNPDSPDKYGDMG